jgi:hypothetical protein
MEELMGQKLDPNTKTILQKARDFLATSPDNWCQNALANYRGAHCAIGAISKFQETPIVHSSAYGEPVVEALAAAVPNCWRETMRLRGERGSAPGLPVFSFNDEPGRTREDVIALFDYAIRGEKMPSPEDN